MLSALGMDGGFNNTLPSAKSLNWSKNVNTFQFEMFFKNLNVSNALANLALIQKYQYLFQFEMFFKKLSLSNALGSSKDP